MILYFIYFLHFFLFLGIVISDISFIIHERIIFYFLGLSQDSLHVHGSPTRFAETIRPVCNETYSRPEFQAFFALFLFQDSGLQGRLRAPDGLAIRTIVASIKVLWTNALIHISEAIYYMEVHENYYFAKI